MEKVLSYNLRVVIEFWWENLKKRHYLEDQGLKGIML
jgi:hypothetical protein